MRRRNYGTADAEAGKAAAKAELRSRMGLSGAEAPLVAVVTRLTHQKGIHLIKHAAWRTLERGAQFVLLGSAPDPRVQVRAPAGTCPCTSQPVISLLSILCCTGQRDSAPSVIAGLLA